MRLILKEVAAKSDKKFMFSRMYVLLTAVMTIMLLASACSINTSFFNQKDLIPRSITIYDHGVPKNYNTGDLQLLTNDTALRLEGGTKPNATITVYISPGDPLCLNPPSPENVLGAHSPQSVEFRVDLTTLPEGTHTLCIYGEYGQDTKASSRLGEVTIKRTVQAFANQRVLPDTRGNERRPSFIGDSEALARMELYAGAGCTGPVLDYSQAAANGAFTLRLPPTNPLLLDGLVSYSVLATDVLGNTRCSTAYSYLLDTVVDTTTILALTPSSPSNINTPLLTGSTERNSHIALYDSDDCTEPALGSSTSDSGGAFSVGLDNPLSLEKEYYLTLRVTDDLGNTECFTSLKKNFIYDITPPALSLLAPLAGTDHQNTFALEVSCEAGSYVEVFGDVSIPITETCAVGTLQLLPSLGGADGSKTIQVRATDAAGNSSTASLNLNKDNVPPPLPSVTRISASPTMIGTVDMTVSSCADIKDVLIKESSSLPSGSEPEWSSCTSAAGATHYDLSVSGAQGTRNLRVFVRDRAGNIQPSFATVLVDYDTLPPEIHLDPIPPFLGTNSYYEFRWSLTEGNVPAGANFTIQYSQTGGTTWTNLATTPVGRTGAVNGKIYKHNQFLPATAGPTIFKVSLTDMTNQTGSDSQSAILLYDITPPVITVSSFTILDSPGPVTTYNPFVRVSFEASDNQTPVTQFCLKNSSSSPALSDPCWVAFNAPGIDVPIDVNVKLTNYDHLVDWITGTYIVHLWVRDQAGNVSVNAGPVNNGTDRISVTYTPIPQPTLAELLVAKTPNPTTQPSPWELVTTPGTTLYLKWKQRVFTGTANVSLWYTIDGTQYTLIEKDLSPGVGLSCTASGSEDVCQYTWNSPVPVNTPYKIQVRLADGIEQTVIKNTVYISNPNFRAIAGNTDPGTHGSAKNAAFRGLFPDSGSFVVSRNGVLFFRDIARGLLMVEPGNGVQKLVLRKTETSTGDGGLLSEATTQGILKIAIDFQDRILLFEPDRIRRIDTRTSPMTIESIIGAFDDGRVGTNSADFVADPHDVKIQLSSTYRMAGLGSPYLIFLVLPNGDIYFQTEKTFETRANGARIRVYRGSAIEPYVDTLRVGGTGDYGDAGTDIGAWQLANMNFVFDPFSNVVSKALVRLNHPIPSCSNFHYANVNPTTLQSLGSGHPNVPYEVCTPGYMIQGMNGQIYALNRNNPWSFHISKFNGSGWTQIIGTGARSSCGDGTLALSCPVIANDMFVSQTGQIYFMDDGLIRILGSDGRIYTLYGYNLSSGDGGDAMEARLNDVISLDHGTTDKVIVLDAQGGRFREIDFKGSPGIKTIAGNGSDAPGSNTPLGVAAHLNPIGMFWSTPGRFATDPTNGNVYWTCDRYNLCRLNRASNVWESVLAPMSGAWAWETATPLHYSDVNGMTGYPPTPMAINGTSLLVGFVSWNGTDTYRSALREFSLSTGSSKHIAGNGSATTGATCPNGAASGCALNTSFFGFGTGAFSPTFHSNVAGTNYWIYLANKLKTVHKVGGGLATKLFDLNENATSIFYRGSYFYYCSAPENGPSLLYRKEATAPYTEVELPLPHGSTCYGNKIIFKNGSAGEPDRLVFPIKQNGISGVAEFLDPENFAP
nr:hypothetical protein HAGR004_10650 [Bdellovibrio sp. HAGR004]